jgi:uroporphyrinogen-III synthase
VLIVRGDGGREWLAETLRGAGAQVEALAAYRRVAPQPDEAQRAVLDAALAQPRAHLWLFSSSEAIDRLDALAGARGPAAWREARAIATHPRIAARARALGIGRVHEAAPGMADVIACIQSAAP